MTKVSESDRSVIEVKSPKNAIDAIGNLSDVFKYSLSDADFKKSVDMFYESPLSLLDDKKVRENLLDIYPDKISFNGYDAVDIDAFIYRNFLDHIFGKAVDDFQINKINSFLKFYFQKEPEINHFNESFGEKSKRAFRPISFIFDRLNKVDLNLNPRGEFDGLGRARINAVIDRITKEGYVNELSNRELSQILYYLTVYGNYDSFKKFADKIDSNRIANILNSHVGFCRYQHGLSKDNFVDEDRRTIIGDYVLTVDSGCTDFAIAKYIIEKGGDVNLKTGKYPDGHRLVGGFCALSLVLQRFNGHKYIDNPLNKDFLPFLLKQENVDVNSLNQGGLSPVARAACYGDISSFRDLLDNGADPWAENGIVIYGGVRRKIRFPCLLVMYRESDFLIEFLKRVNFKEDKFDFDLIFKNNPPIELDINAKKHLLTNLGDCVSFASSCKEGAEEFSSNFFALFSKIIENGVFNVNELFGEDYGNFVIALLRIYKKSELPGFKTQVAKLIKCAIDKGADLDVKTTGGETFFSLMDKVDVGGEIAGLVADKMPKNRHEVEGLASSLERQLLSREILDEKQSKTLDILKRDIDALKKICSKAYDWSGVASLAIELKCYGFIDLVIESDILINYRVSVFLTAIANGKLWELNCFNGELGDETNALREYILHNNFPIIQRVLAEVFCSIVDDFNNKDELGDILKSSSLGFLLDVIEKKHDTELLKDCAFDPEQDYYKPLFERVSNLSSIELVSSQFIRSFMKMNGKIRNGFAIKDFASGVGKEKFSQYVKRLKDSFDKFKSESKIQRSEKEEAEFLLKCNVYVSCVIEGLEFFLDQGRNNKEEVKRVKRYIDVFGRGGKLNFSEDLRDFCGDDNIKALKRVYYKCLDRISGVSDAIENMEEAVGKVEKVSNAKINSEDGRQKLEELLARFVGAVNKLNNNGVSRKSKRKRDLDPHGGVRENKGVSSSARKRTKEGVGELSESAGGGSSVVVDPPSSVHQRNQGKGKRKKGGEGDGRLNQGGDGRGN